MSKDTKDVDMALILEGRIKERVNEVLQPMVDRTVVNIIGKEIDRVWEEHKHKMMMEIAVTVGKIIGEAHDDNHKPLWEYKPEEFGFIKAPGRGE